MAKTVGSKRRRRYVPKLTAARASGVKQSRSIGARQLSYFEACGYRVPITLPILQFMLRDNIEDNPMCDYSLTHVASRPAKVGDKLVITGFGTGTRGFASPEDFGTAVCVLPGTELAFEEDVNAHVPLLMALSGRSKQKYKTAIFRQINKDQLCMHHDALELPSGEVFLLTSLVEGQRATVLQLPAAPVTEQEAQEQKRLEVVA